MIIKLPFCPRCRAPHVPPEIAERIRNGEQIEVDIIYPSGVAGNVLRWGTGAINVDGCRVEADWENDPSKRGFGYGWARGETYDRNVLNAPEGRAFVPEKGRWPANVVTDGSAEVLAAFPETASGAMRAEVGSYPGGGVTTLLRGSSGPSNQRADSGSAARFFASFPQQNETRCGLCGLLWMPVSDTDGSCDANSAELNSSTESTPSGASVRCDAVVLPALESAAKRNPSSDRVISAESPSSPCHPPSQGFVRATAPLAPLSKIAQNVQSAANLCGSCATDIAQRLAASRLGQDPASRPLPDFISERSAQILKQYLALYVEGQEGTDIILTIPKLTILFGSVFHAIECSIENEELLRKAEIKSASRFRYSSKANSDSRLGSKHPTVKPVDLMQWLCRLVTPPPRLVCPQCAKLAYENSAKTIGSDSPMRTVRRDVQAARQQTSEPLLQQAVREPTCPHCGSILELKRSVVLDPFSGTGTTGEAAWREGFSAVLIERESEYCADIGRRMALCLAGPATRAAESAKARYAGKPEDHGPLFGGTSVAGGGERYTADSQTRNRTDRIEEVTS